MQTVKIAEQEFPITPIDPITGNMPATIILGDPKDKDGDYFYPRRRRPSHGIGLSKMDIKTPKTAMDAVGLAVSTDPDRPETLHHIHHDAGALVAADGFRLHLAHGEGEKECQWCKEHPKDQFPDYKCLFPHSAKYKATADAEELAQAFIRAGIFARDGSNVAIIKANGHLEVIGRSEENGETMTTIECESNGAEIRFGINWKFARDAIRHVAPKGGPVEILVQSPTSPIIIKANDREALIMPMHLG